MFDEKQIVVLTAFAGLMIATNLINSALNVDLDDYLTSYKERGRKMSEFSGKTVLLQEQQKDRERKLHLLLRKKGQTSSI